MTNSKQKGIEQIGENLDIQGLIERVDNTALQIIAEVVSANNSSISGSDKLPLSSGIFPKLEQRKDFHEHRVYPHGLTAGTILSQILWFKHEDRTAKGFINPIAKFNHDLFPPYKNSTEELQARAGSIDSAWELINELNLLPEEITLLVIAAFLHDIGKFLEPQHKIRDISATNIQSPQVTKQDNLWYIQHQDEIQELQKQYPFIDAQHLQDLLTIYVYNRMLKEGVINEQQSKFLIQTHLCFTQMSQHRYSGKIKDWPQYLTDLGSTKITTAAALLLFADEIGKGQKFIESEIASTQRITKFNTVTTILRAAIHLNSGN